MYRLLVWSSKGGVGKTTSVANLGPALARRGNNVLLVGFDAHQPDLEMTFGIEDDDDDVTRIEDLLAGSADPLTATIEIDDPVAPTRNHKPGGSLRLLATSERLLALTADVAATGRFDALDQLLMQLDKTADIALIDTTGAVTPLTRMAMFAADGILFCGEPGVYEAKTIARRLDELDELGVEAGHAITPVGMLFVRTNARSRQLRAWATAFADPEQFPSGPLYVFQTHIRQQSSVRDHPGFGVPTVFADPGGRVAQDYAAAAKELEARLAELAQDQAA